MRHVSILVCLLLVACPSTAAAEPIYQTHVRSESADMRRVIVDGVERSPTFRALVDEIDETDVVVYVRTRVLLSQMLEGRTGFLGLGPSGRFLAIELACPRTIDAQIATLAHELQHAVEIARARWVVDAQTLREYYEVIGIEVLVGSGGRAFETKAAADIGRRVRREMTGSASKGSR